MENLPLNLSDEELNKISHLASINSDVFAIARFLNIDPDIFESEYMIEGSAIRKSIDTGINASDFAIGKKQLEDAKNGDKESIREFKKDAKEAKWRRFKDKQLYDKEFKNAKADYENLRKAIDTGGGELSDDMKKYYNILEFIRSLYSRMNSRSYIVSHVRLKWPDISYNIAIKLYYDSINFFNIDNNVKKEAWANAYAEQLEIISNIAFEHKDMDTAGKYRVEAAKLRGLYREAEHQIPAEFLDRRPILYSIKITDLGGTPVNRHKLGALIDNLDVSEKDKTRLRRDSQIEDIPFQLFDNDNE